MTIATTSPTPKDPRRRRVRRSLTVPLHEPVKITVEFEERRARMIGALRIFAELLLRRRKGLDLKAGASVTASDGAPPAPRRTA